MWPILHPPENQAKVQEYNESRSVSMAIEVGQGKVAIFVVVGETPEGLPAPVKGTATIDDYASAYIVNTGNAGEYMLVPKVTPAPGTSVSLNVSFSATAVADGTSISFSLAFSLLGQPLAAATQLVNTSSQVVSAADVEVLPDPGSGTIPIA